MSPADCAARLQALHPALFGGRPKPLKLRIQHDIQERNPGVFSRQVLAAFFRRYTTSWPYLSAMAQGTHRHDLDGQPVAELSAEHRQLAADELKRRRAGRQAKQEQEQQEREARARLLRDHERTTLTAANFAALKGIAVDELPALLEQARREAAEAPPPRPFRGEQQRRGRPDQPPRERGGGGAEQRDERRPPGPGGRGPRGPRGPR